MTSPQADPPNPYVRPEQGRHRLDRVLSVVPPIAEHPPIEPRRRLTDLLAPPAGLVFLAGAAFGAAATALAVSVFG